MKFYKNRMRKNNECYHPEIYLKGTENNNDILAIIKNYTSRQI